jgi:signal transduction histidine kinase
MGSDINTLAQALETLRGSTPVPLLAFRLPQLERIAWREGRRAAQRLERRSLEAFIAASRQVLRSGDLTAHDRGTEVFIILLCAPSREARIAANVDCRAVLERVAAAISLRVDLQIETGWALLRDMDAAGGIQRGIEMAFERGARERERYEFFAAIGHELRTPLTSIRGYLETLIDGGVDPATSRRFLETARGEALRMGRLLDGMFEFSLLDLSAQALLGHGCDIAAQIHLACEVVRPLSRSRRIQIHRRACVQASTLVEPDACLQLLVNLLDNAIKYGRDGGTVRIAANLEGKSVVVAVDDDGPGILPTERESIFSLRVRGTQSAGRPGTGIGLAIVKMIAERAGGSIAVRESPLGGARFEVALPLGAELETPVS